MLLIDVLGHTAFAKSATKPRQQIDDSVQPTTQQANNENGLKNNLFVLLAAEFLRDRQNFRAATSLYESQAYQSDAVPIFERALTLALDDKHEGSSQRALDLVNFWSDKNPAYVSAWFYEAHFALKARKYELAAQTLSKIVQYEPDADLEQILTGVSPESPEAQANLLRALTAVKSSNPTLLALKASLHFNRSEYNKALGFIDAALRQKPMQSSLILLKAKILMQIDPAQSEAFIASAQHAQPDSKSLALYQIRQLLKNNRAEEAYTLLISATKRFNQDNEVKLLASLVAIDTEHYQQAKIMLTELKNDFSYSDQASYYLGVAFEREGDLAAAADHFAKVEQHDLLLDAQRKLALIRLGQNQPQLAIAGLQSFAQAHPEFFSQAVRLQAKIMTQMGDTALAKQLLLSAANGAVLSQTARADVLYDYAMLIEPASVNELNEKLRVLEILVNDSPNNTGYTFALASTLADAQLQTQRAINLSEQILAQKPAHQQVRSLLGRLYFQAGYLAKAADLLQQQYQLSPDPKDGVLLMSIYKSLGQSRAAQAVETSMNSRFGKSLTNSVDMQTP